VLRVESSRGRATNWNRPTPVTEAVESSKGIEHAIRQNATTNGEICNHNDRPLSNKEVVGRGAMVTNG
jgi:hypothetical protein